MMTIHDRLQHFLDSSRVIVKARLRPKADESGFFVIEAVLATTIMMVVLLASAAEMTNNSLASADAQNRVAATSIAGQMATQWQSVLASQSAGTFTPPPPLGHPNYPPAAGSISMGPGLQALTYIVTSQWCLSTTNSSEEVLTVNVAASWLDSGVTHSVDQSTSVAPPVGYAWQTATC